MRASAPASFAELRPTCHRRLRRWLDTWAGIDLVAAGMVRQAYNLSLTCHGERKQVTVLFADVVGFSTLGEHLATPQPTSSTC